MSVMMVVSGHRQHFIDYMRARATVVLRLTPDAMLDPGTLLQYVLRQLEKKV
jgi:hypothetical protein